MDLRTEPIQEILDERKEEEEKQKILSNLENGKVLTDEQRTKGWRKRFEVKKM